MTSMLYMLAQDIGGLLQARKFPLEVLYGPERLQRVASGGYALTLVLERDSLAGDQIRAPQGAQENPRRHNIRDQGCVARMWAQSTLPGARRCDHEYLCDQLVDGFTVELARWASHTRAVGTAITSAKYMGPTEVNAAASLQFGLESWPGVAYEVRFTLPRGVYGLDFEGEAQETGAADTVVNVPTVELGPL